MIDDTKKELEQLEKLLSLDEEWFRRELDSAKRMIGQDPGQPTPASRAAAPAKAMPIRNYGGGYGQTAPRQPEQKEEPVPRSIGRLLILASLEALGILGLAAYWVLVLLR
jgi:hypothetical protein